MYIISERLTIITMILALFLSACGDTRGQRALSGGAIGAGAGVGIAVLTHSNPVTAALIGGGAGAATGALTSKKQINLGPIN